MAFWKPLEPDTSTPTAAPGAGTLGVIKRPDGTMQVTDNHKPLYTFSEDSPGKATGNGSTDEFGGHHFTWHVITPPATKPRPVAPASPQRATPAPRAPATDVPDRKAAQDLTSAPPQIASIAPNGPYPDRSDTALYELSVRDGAQLRSAVRWELFVFPAVRDVLAGRDPDRVLVVHRGPPQPAAWTEALRNAGFDPHPTARDPDEGNPPTALDP
jgi:hypothetical protein